MKILVVEDDEKLAGLVKRGLASVLPDREIADRCVGKHAAEIGFGEAVEYGVAAQRIRTRLTFRAGIGSYALHSNTV